MADPLADDDLDQFFLENTDPTSDLTSVDTDEDDIFVLSNTEPTDVPPAEAATDDDIFATEGITETQGDNFDALIDDLYGGEDEEDFLKENTEHKGGLISDSWDIATSFAGGVVRGAAQELGTQVDIPYYEGSNILEESTAEMGEGLSGEIGSGFGQAGVRVGITSAFSALGAAAGTPFAGIGAVPGAAIGGLVGTGIGFLYTMAQGTRAELNGVEETVRATSEATGELLEAQVDEARTKAFAPILAGQGADSALAVFTGGSMGAIRRGTAASIKAGVTGGLAGGTRQAAIQIEQAILRKTEQEALRQMTRTGMIKAALVSGAGEAVGEYVSEVGKQVAIETTLTEEGFFDATMDALTSPEARRAALVGGIVGTGVRGIGETVGARRRANQDRGLEIYAESLGLKLSGDSARAIEINRAIAALQNPEDPRTEVEIPDYVATREELSRIVEALENIDEGIELGPEPTEAGNTLRVKAERLQEIEETARIIKGVEKEEAKLKKQIRQVEESIERQLNRIGDPVRDIAQDIVGTEKLGQQGQRFETRTDEQILVQAIQTEEALNRKLQDLADLKQIEAELGISHLTKDERRLIVQEAEGLQQFFKNVEEDTATEERRAGRRIELRKELDEIEKEIQADSTDARKARMLRGMSDIKLSSLINHSTSLGRKIEAAHDQLRAVENQLSDPELTPSGIGDYVALKEKQNMLEEKVAILRAEKEGYDAEVGLDKLDRNQRAEILDRAFKFTTLMEQGQHYLEQDHTTDPRSQAEIDAEIKTSSVTYSKNNTKPNNAIAALYQSIKVGLNLDEGLFGVSNRQKVVSSRIESQAARNAVIKGMERDLARLDRAIKQHIGVKATDDSFLQRMVRKPARQMDALSKDKRKKYSEELRKVGAYLKGELIEENLPDRVRGAAVFMRTRLDGLTTSLQENGVVEGDLVYVLEENKGTYVNRSYQIFRDPAWAEKVSEEVRNRAKSFIRNELAHKRNKGVFKHKTDEEWESYVDGVMESLLVKNVHSPLQVISHSGIDRQVRNILKRRGDIPPEIRALWGEDTNAITMYANSVHQMMQVLASHDHLSRVKEIGMGDFLFEPHDMRPGYTIPISDKDAPGLKPLAGLRTSEEVYTELRKIYQTKNFNAATKAYFQLNGVAKYGATVLSPVTQWRNFYSNWFILMRNGNLLNPELFSSSTKDSFKMAFGDLLPGYFLNPKAEHRADRAAVYDRLIELGVIDDAITSAEWEAAFQDAFGGDLSFQKYADNTILNANQRALDAAKVGITKVTDISTRLYRASDTVAKAIGWHAEVARYRKNYPNWTKEQVERKAAEIIRNTMPTYSMVPDLIKWNRKNILFGPFVSFASETIRNEYHTVRLALEELSKRETFSSGLNRIFSWGLGSSARIGIAMLGMAATHTTPEDEEAIRTLAAPWDKNSSLLFIGTDDKGNPRYYNISRTLPDSQLADPINAYYRDLPGYEVFKEATLQFLSPFISEELVAQRLVDAWRGVRSDGVEIFSSEDTDSEKWLKRVTHVLDAATPGVIRQGMRAWNAYHGEPTRTGQPLTFSDEMVALTTGQRLTTLDIRRAVSFRAFEFTDGVAQATKDFRRVVASRQTVSDSEIRAAYNKLQAARERRFKQMNKEYYAAIRLRFDPEELQEYLLNETDIGAERLEYVLTGQLQPFIASDNLIDDIEKVPGRLEQIERALGGAEIF